MITVISGTNRADSMTLRTANLYCKLLSEQEKDVKLLSLEHKQVGERGAEMITLEKEYLIPAQKFLIIRPNVFYVKESWVGAEP